MSNLPRRLLEEAEDRERRRLCSCGRRACGVDRNQIPVCKYHSGAPRQIVTYFEGHGVFCGEHGSWQGGGDTK